MISVHEIWLNVTCLDENILSILTCPHVTRPQGRVPPLFCIGMWAYLVDRGLDPLKQERTGSVRSLSSVLCVLSTIWSWNSPVNLFNIPRLDTGLLWDGGTVHHIVYYVLQIKLYITSNYRKCVVFGIFFYSYCENYYGIIVSVFEQGRYKNWKNGYTRA
jgi:hypothetical protein